MMWNPVETVECEKNVNFLSLPVGGSGKGKSEKKKAEQKCVCGSRERKNRKSQNEIICNDWHNLLPRQLPDAVGECLPFSLSFHDPKRALSSLSYKQNTKGIDISDIITIYELEMDLQFSDDDGIHIFFVHCHLLLSSYHRYGEL